MKTLMPFQLSQRYCLLVNQSAVTMQLALLALDAVLGILAKIRGLDCFISPQKKTTRQILVNIIDFIR